jgi:hypothetical protein
MSHSSCAISQCKAVAENDVIDNTLTIICPIGYYLGELTLGQLKTIEESNFQLVN